MCRGPKRWSGDPWHPTQSAESCWLPPLTRFTNGRRTGPGHRCGPRRSKATASAPIRSRVALLAGNQFERMGSRPGGVRERPNRHDWKSCEGKPSVGSNPTSSATGSWRRRNPTCRERLRARVLAATCAVTAHVSLLAIRHAPSAVQTTSHATMTHTATVVLSGTSDAPPPPPPPPPPPNAWGSPPGSR
jgi:hypothetical protein